VIASRLLVLGALLLGACAAPTWGEAAGTMPAIPPGCGRIVFLGDNLGRYGMLEGANFEPVISVDGTALNVGHGIGVCFAADVLAGRRRIAVDGVDHLSLMVESNATRYVGLQIYAEENDGFGLRKFNYRMRLLNLTEAQAAPRLPQLEFLGLQD